MNILQQLAMAPQGQDGGGSMMSTVIMFGLIIVIFYFMILRPQQKKAKERTKLLESLQKGDKVITVGGVYATVVHLEEKTVLVQIADDVKIKLERTAISTIMRDADSVGKTA